MNDGWMAVDLDGTLAYYDGWKGVDHIGHPITAMIARVKSWRQMGLEVRVFTARISYAPEKARPVIEAWCLEHIGEILPVTNLKDFGMIELWDDRCRQVEANTGRLIE